MQAFHPFGGIRMRKQIAAIPALAGVLLFATAPALADQSVKTQGGDVYPAFSPTSVTISPGEKVTFTNSGDAMHDVAWDDGFATNPSSPQLVWTSAVSRTFTTPGVYRFYCQNHGGPNGAGMSGKVIVLNPNGTPPPGVTPDTKAPSLGKLTVSLGRKRFTLKFSSSEKGTASGTIQRRNSTGKFKTFGSVSFGVGAGSNSRTIKKTSSGRSLTLGKFRVSFRVKDAAGNKSSTKTATFTITR
jgi:plastocyanin